ncbi:MAG: glycosyltransferase family 4 protein [Leptolyngbyaceae cyanobacterium]
MVKVSVLFENYGPYHMSRLEAFQELCNLSNWEIFGIELARSQHKYQWKADPKSYPVNLCSILEDQPLEEVSLFTLIRKSLGKMHSLNPDVIAIAGYSHPAMLAILAWSLWNRKSTVLMSASKEDDAPRSAKTEYLKRQILRAFNAALVGGKPQKHYLLKLGKSCDSVFTGYNVVGNDTFHPNNISYLSTPLNKSFFLTINRFIPKKNLFVLLEAYAAYRQAVGTQAQSLVLSGDGPLRSELEETIHKLNIQDSVYLPGFLQQQDLLPYFAHATCFIHASIQEQWGLVVNEAMAAGLPVIVSNQCGCFEDLVIEGINGFGFDPNNQKQLTDLMLKITSQSVDLEKMSAAALAHIQNFSPDYFAKGLKQAVEYALSH